MQMRQLMDGKYSNEMVLITEPAEERLLKLCFNLKTFCGEKKEKSPSKLIRRYLVMLNNKQITKKQNQFSLPFLWYNPYTHVVPLYFIQVALYFNDCVDREEERGVIIH